MTTDTACRCSECAAVHSDFLAHFGKWPTMSHDAAMRLRSDRIQREAKWSRVID